MLNFNYSILKVIIMKYLKCFLLFVFAITVWACEDMDFIEEVPESDYLLTGVNKDVLEGLVLGAYEPLSRSRGRLWESIYGSAVELMGEYALSVTGNFNVFATYNFAAVRQNELNPMWTSFYEAIGRANFLIQSVEENTTLPVDVRDRAIAEGRFIRALVYYQLVRAWGEVPLRLAPVTNADEIGQPLASIDNIYAQIIADLQFAENGLPETVPPASAGRATKGAAMTMLADVYLTRGDYPNARSKSLEVINSKEAFGYNLEPSFEVLYSPTSPTNPEDIFSIKFAQIRAQGNFLPAYAHDNRANAAGLAARGLRRFTTYESVPLIRDWDMQDMRRSWNLYDSITIAGERLPANVPLDGDYLFGKYRDPDAPEETAAGNDFYLYRYADVLLIFAEAENQINGPTIAAYDAINQVRRRGYGVDVNMPSELADLPEGLSKTEFDDLVFRERGYEFFFECKRWFDLKRTGRWEKFVNESGIKSVPTQGEFWPIPNIEIANNPEIK